MDYIKHNIEHAIQGAFKIKGVPVADRSIKEHGVEVSGFAIASQEAHELNAVLKKYELPATYYFAPHGRWSVINISKIKVKWAAPVLPGASIAGHWEGRTFYPDMLSDKVKVKIITSHKEVPSECKYTYVEDISSIVPVVRFNKKDLECVDPKSISTVVINHQGIYINRASASAASVSESTSSEGGFKLCIYYEGVLVHTSAFNFSE